MAAKRTFMPEVGIKFGGRMQNPKPSTSAPAPKPNDVTVIGYELPPVFSDTKQSGFIPPVQKESIPNNTALVKSGSNVPNEKVILPESKARIIGYETPVAFRDTKGTVFNPPVQKDSAQNSTIFTDKNYSGPNEKIVIPESKAVIIGREPPQVFRDTKQSGFIPPIQRDHPTVFKAGDTPFKPI